MNERRAEFLSLQNGKPVRGSDLLKNEVRCRLMAKLNQHGYEEMMRQFFDHCSKKAPKFWANWVAKMYLMMETDKPEDVFVIGDSKIAKRIKESHSSLNPSDDEFAEFHYKFLDFVEFLSELEESIVLNPTQMFVLFYYIAHHEYTREVLHSHMRNFSKEGQVRKFKNLWEKDDCEPRREYFNSCLEQLSRMTEPAKPYDYRQPGKSLKKKVWKKCVNGICEICRQTEITKDSFECGHIQSRALGGQTELDNLIPICRDCNRSMGTRNAYEYRDDVYPLL
jgi:5-methylcytosine-specific restriction endonuclease McrA